jgi:Fe-S-cluster-containing dehydrogenase component
METISLTINSALCTGCRACELACSFHTEKICDPSISKIKINRNHETGEIIHDIPSACAGCSSEIEPACVAACPTGALLHSREIAAEPVK